MQTAPRPDMETLVRGGQDRRRRRNLSRFGLAAAVTVLAGGAAFGVTQLDFGDKDAGTGIADVPKPTEIAADVQYLPGDDGPIKPGTYRGYVDGSRYRIEADWTMERPGWASRSAPTVTIGGATGSVGVYQPALLASGYPCSDNWQSRPARTTAEGVANQLAKLPRSTVLAAPTPTQTAGYSAFHLQLRIDDQCALTPGNYKVGEGRGVTYAEEPTEIVMDFWVVDLNGTPVIIDQLYPTDASETLIDEVTQVRESIRFVSPN